MPKLQPEDGLVGQIQLRQALSSRPPKRIVLLARDMIGDVVNTTGAILKICERFPKAEITLEVGKSAVPLFENFPAQLDIWSREKKKGLMGKVKIGARLKSGRFDLAISLDDSNEKIRMAKAAGIPLIVGIRKDKLHDSFTASAPLLPGKHDLFDLLADVLRLLDIEPDVRPRLFPSEQHRREASEVLSHYNGRLVAIHVDGTSERKVWPPENFAILMEELRHNDFVPLVTSSPNSPYLEELRRFGNPHVLPAMPLLAYAAALERIGLLITGDTGPAHIAGAMGVPAIVLYGPTMPSRFHPWGDNHVLLHHPNGCDHYANVCQGEKELRRCDRRCMRLITPNEVLQATKGLVD